VRWAIPASVSIHVGLIAAAWMFAHWEPEEISLSEAAVSIDIVSMEDAVAEPTETISEESVNLVSAGVTQAASEPEETVETEALEAVEVAAAQPVQPLVAAATPVVEAVEAAESEALVSAEVLTALPTDDAPVAAAIPQVTDDAAPTVAETVAPSDAPILERLEQAAKLATLEPTEDIQQITTASIAPTTPVEPLESTIPVKVANLAPVTEEVIEEVVDAPPIPAPRLVRKPVEAEAKPVEDKKPVEKKKVEKSTDKPVEKKQPKKVASLGNGGENDADSAATKASGGSAGKVTSAGAGALDAYQGKVRSKLIKAVRKPSGRYDGGEARVMFTLDASGRVLKASLSRSSGDDKVDKAVLAAVSRAAPFPPFPEGAGKSTWSFTFPLVIQ
jgi:protein TonB